MEQANKPTFWQIAATGLISAVCFGFARYFHMEGGAMLSGISTFLTTIGWLLLIGAVILMLLWAAKSS
jgi:phage shock protein PspC (stress-responsive transcriptional regulator)